MTVDIIDRGSGDIQRIPLDFNADNACELRLELAPGSSSVQVVARDNGRVLAWIEVPATSGEDVTVEFRRDSTGGVRAFSQKRTFLTMPEEEPPKPLAIKPPSTDELDAVVLVDGTCLHPDGAAALAYLLSPELGPVWKGFADRIAEFLTMASDRYPKIWGMAAAFGDEPMPMLANELLKPTYLVYPPPNRRRLESVTPGQLAKSLGSLPHTPGGDFVDGLADGLHACLQAPWRQNSRKLLLLFGQSPGYSILDSEDDMTNLLIRKRCIEEEVEALCRKGIEIVTIFHKPLEADERYQTDLPEVLQQTQDQYRKLASLREWSCVSPDFDVPELANRWLQAPPRIARGPSPGLVALP